MRKALACLFLLLLFGPPAFSQTRKLTDNGAVVWDYSTGGAIKPVVTVTKDIAVFLPTAADTGKVQIYWPSSVTITKVECSTDTGTIAVQFDERAVATPNTAGTNTLTGALTCDNNSQSTISFSDATIAAAVPWNLQLASDSGTPGVVRIHVTATSP